ncbi:MAG: HK97 family phage prohead protease [Desulfitobacteriaceae bacterium]
MPDDNNPGQKGIVEYRAVQLRASLLNTEEGQSLLKVLEGRAIAFDTPTPIFQDVDGTQYHEQIHHDALNGVDLSNVVLKYNHSEHVPPLASTKAGTLDLKVDDTGLGITARMANTTQASDIHELVRTGHLDKMSFAFTVANDAYDSKTKTRTIFKFDKIYDVSVVDFPAYEQTSVSARNYIKAQQETRDLEIQRQEQVAEQQKRQAELEAEEAMKQEVVKEQQRQEQKARELEVKEQEAQEEQQRKQLVLKTFL